MLRGVPIAIALSLTAPMSAQVAGQPAGSAQYEVISIKITAGAPDRSGMRISPDGSFTMTSRPGRGGPLHKSCVALPQAAFWGESYTQ